MYLWRATESVTWHENDGRGNFGTGLVVTASSSSPDMVIAADLDGDVDLDLVIADNDGVMWFENTSGQGAFSPLSASIEADMGRST